MASPFMHQAHRNAETGCFNRSPPLRSTNDYRAAVVCRNHFPGRACWDQAISSQFALGSLVEQQARE